MNLDLEALAKAVYVALLLIFLAALDRLQINDPLLRNTAFGLIGTIIGWHGVNNWPGYKNAGSAAIAQLAALLQPAANATSVTAAAPIAAVTGSAAPPSAPSTPQ